MDIFFFEIEIILLYSVDLSYLISNNSKDNFRRIRGNPLWINEIIDAFSKVEGKNIIVTKENSLYREFQNARIEKYTFSDYFIAEHMPIKFEFVDNPVDISSNYILANTSLRLDKDGVISIRYKIIPKNKETYVKIDQTVNEINRIRTKILDQIMIDINRFATFWNGYYKNINLDNASRNIISNIHTYEIILFDYKTDENQIPIKDMFELENLDLGRQLIGFARMDRPEVWNKHSKKFILDFCQKDIGNRIDEFWLIYYERFLRYHPKRKEEIFERWFEDVTLGVEILLHKKALLECINRWANKKLFRLENITARALIKEQNNKNITDLSKSIDQDIVEINNMAKIISDPLLLERNVPHQFYNRIITSIIKELSIDKLLTSTKNQFSEIYRFYDTTKKTMDSILAINLQKSVSRLTILLVVLTIILIILTTGISEFIYSKFVPILIKSLEEIITNILVVR